MKVYISLFILLCKIFDFYLWFQNNIPPLDIIIGISPNNMNEGR